MNKIKEMLRAINNSILLNFILLIIIIYSPYFLHLGNLPLRVWDESRLITNAVEMASNHNYIVTYFNGQPDMWNTKPPLMIWSQVISMNLFGNQELSFRLPSAIAGFLTCILIVFVTLRYGRSFLFGFLAVLILITSEGHLGNHVARTADYDALLSFFVALYALSYLLWIEIGKTKYLHFFFLGLSLSVLTKGISGLMFLPGLVIYTIVMKKFRLLLTQKWLYVHFITFLIIICGYYLSREALNPGYLKAVYQNELGGRFGSSIEGHHERFIFYFDLLFNRQFVYYSILAILGIVISFQLPQGFLRKLTQYSTIISLTYLLLISIAKTKLTWYTAPAIPFFAIIAASSIYYFLSTVTNTSYLPKTIVKISVIALIFIYPYQKVINEVYKPSDDQTTWNFLQLGYFLQGADKGHFDLNNKYILYNGYKPHLEYYVNKMKQEGVNVSFIHQDSIDAGDEVIYSTYADKHLICRKWKTTEVFGYYDVKTLRIDSLKYNYIPEP